jgi:WD40 repeat protein
MCRLAWSPSGAYLAVPVFDNEIALLEHESWEEWTRIGPHPAMVSGVYWSKNGVYLCATCVDGSLVLWEPAVSIEVPVFT